MLSRLRWLCSVAIGVIWLGRPTSRSWSSQVTLPARTGRRLVRMTASGLQRPRDRETGVMKKQPRHSPETIERAARMVSGLPASTDCSGRPSRRSRARSAARQPGMPAGARYRPASGPATTGEERIKALGKKCAGRARQTGSGSCPVNFSPRRNSNAASEREGVHRAVRRMPPRRLA